MKTSTAVIVVGAAAVAALILFRPKPAAATTPAKGAADVLTSMGNFGTALAHVLDHDDEDSR